MIMLWLQTIVAVFTFGKEFLKYLESQRGSGCSPKDARKDALAKIADFNATMRKGLKNGDTKELEDKFAALGIRRVDPPKRVSDK